MLKQALIIMLCLLPAQVLASAGYSSVIEDLPLMPGMIEQAGESLVFDKPDGRIIETVAEAPSAAADIEKFYRDALPPLGWDVRPTGEFLRAGEALKITFDQNGQKTLVYFTLSPEGN